MNTTALPIAEFVAEHRAKRDIINQAMKKFVDCIHFVFVAGILMAAFTVIILWGILSRSK